MLACGVLNQLSRQAHQRIGPKIVPDFRKARCANSKSYSDFCASQKTRGAVARFSKLMCDSLLSAASPEALGIDQGIVCFSRPAEELRLIVGSEEILRASHSLQAKRR